MNKFSLNKKQILDYQMNRNPFLMIDYVDEVVPGKYANGYKMLDEDEWFFKVHWPGDPNMPGMLQIESLVQMCALNILTLKGNKGKIMYVISANNLKFFKKVLPKSKFILKTLVKSYLRGIAICTGEGFVNKEKVCQADFKLVLPDELNKDSLRK